MSHSPSAPSRVPESRLRALLACAAISFILVAALTSQYTLEVQRRFAGGSHFNATVLVSLPLLGFIAGPALGSRLVHRLGALHVLRVGSALPIALGSLGALYAATRLSGDPSTIVFAISRIVVGIGGGLTFTSLAYTSSQLPSERRGPINVLFQGSVVFALIFALVLPLFISLPLMLGVAPVGTAVLLWVATLGLPEHRTVSGAGHQRPARQGRRWAWGAAILLQTAGTNALLYFGTTVVTLTFPATRPLLGVENPTTFAFGLGIPLVNAIMTVYAIRRGVGERPRKPFLQRGALGMFCAMAAVTGSFALAVFVFPHSLLVGVLFIFSAVAFIFFFAPSWGALVFAMIPEFFPEETRDRGVQEAIFLNSVANAVLTIGTALLALSGNVGALILFALLTVGLLINNLFARRLPETLELSDEQIRRTFG